MAGKKFTIPSLSEMESSKREEYKVKTLFDKHKKSSLSKTTDFNDTRKDVSASNVVKATGLSSAKSVVETSAQKSLNGDKVTTKAQSVTTTFGQKPQNVTQTSGKSSLLIPARSENSQKVSPQRGVQTGQQSGGGGGLSVGSVPPAGISPTRPSRTLSLIVNPRQRGNPVLKNIRSVPWEFGDIVADYEMGTVMCALFLSLRYHNLNPNYIHERLKLLGHSYDLRVLLVQVDTKDPHHALRELAKICILADCTLICAWTPEEAGRYLETYKVFERKPPDMIMEKQEVDFTSRAQEVLTSGRKINRTDVLTLMSTFGSFENIVRAGEEELSFCPGLGLHKAKRLHTMLHEPFLKAKQRKKLEESDPDKNIGAAAKN